MHPALRQQSGQASVEFVAVLPLALLVGLVAWQLALAGHAAWLCAQAARAGARAELIGSDPRTAARSTLPRNLERGLRVERRRGGAVRVSVGIPLLVWGNAEAVKVSATSSLGGTR
jgi:hypothetical protein